MPKNIEIVPEYELTTIEVAGNRQFTAVPAVQTFGHTVCRPMEKYHFARRTRLEFCLRLESAEEYAEDEIDGRIYRTRFPHLLVKKPGTAHYYQPRTPRRAVFIIYEAEQSAYFSGAGFPLDPPGREFTLTPAIDALISELIVYETQAHDCGVPDQIDLAAVRLLTAIYAQHWEQRQMPTAERAIRKIAAYLECHFGEEVNLDKLVREYGFSRRSFFRHWNALYSQTPAQFVLEKRMAHARRLLTETDMPIGIMGEHLGFCGGGYFIQAFKRQFGVSPMAFRRAGISTAPGR